MSSASTSLLVVVSVRCFILVTSLSKTGKSWAFCVLVLQELRSRNCICKLCISIDGISYKRRSALRIFNKHVHFDRCFFIDGIIADLRSYLSWSSVSMNLFVLLPTVKRTRIIWNIDFDDKILRQFYWKYNTFLP